VNHFYETILRAQGQGQECIHTVSKTKKMIQCSRSITFEKWN